MRRNKTQNMNGLWKDYYELSLRLKTDDVLDDYHSVNILCKLKNINRNYQVLYSNLEFWAKLYINNQCVDTYNSNIDFVLNEEEILFNTTRTFKDTGISTSANIRVEITCKNKDKKLQDTAIFDFIKL